MIFVRLLRAAGRLYTLRRRAGFSQLLVKDLSPGRKIPFINEILHHTVPGLWYFDLHLAVRAAKHRRVFGFYQLRRCLRLHGDGKCLRFVAGTGGISQRAPGDRLCLLVHRKTLTGGRYFPEHLPIRRVEQSILHTEYVVDLSGISRRLLRFYRIFGKLWKLLSRHGKVHAVYGG